MIRAAAPIAKVRKAWSDMTADELAQATAGLENIDYKDSRRAATQPKGRMARPRQLPWDQAMRALDSSLPEPVARAAAVADAAGLKRSEFLAGGLTATVAAMEQSMPRRDR